MKLFSPQEVKNKQRDAAEKDAILAVKASKVSNEQRTKLNNIRDWYEAQKQQILEDFQTFSDENEAQKRTLTNEVAELTRVRKELMKPIDALNQEAHDRIAAAETIENQLNEYEQEIKDKEETTKALEVSLKADTASLKRATKACEVRVAEVQKGEAQLLQAKETHDQQVIRDNTAITAQKAERDGS